MISALWLQELTTASSKSVWTTPLGSSSEREKTMAYNQEVIQFEVLIFIALKRIIVLPVNKSSHTHNLKSTRH